MASNNNSGGGCGTFIILIIIAAVLIVAGVPTGTIIATGAVAAGIIILVVILAIIAEVKKDNEEKRRKELITNSPVNTLSPIQYEEYVALYLQKLGYKNVRTTKASGDFGADVLCENAKGIKICVQCKHYSKPIGVKAVQEVISAREYYKCQEAWVCASNTYTPSAYEMASKTGVKLYTIR